MLKKVFRVVFTVLGMLFGYGASTLVLDEVAVAGEFFGEYGNLVLIPASVLLFGFIFFNLYPMVHKRGETVIKGVVSDVEKFSIL